ncbi:STN domain-containing protein [Pedobacter nototheniae]|uniref:STN domain-containing protein n=1 Tax=Pedobacter nototheniae TaxID=2488994 RepID=UPI002931B302|nr:STN domain-containing protein [Pedobacter nototheniae]
MHFYTKFCFFLLFLIRFSFVVHAQTTLNRKISLQIENQSLKKVLAMIEQKGDFRFSFNSNIMPLDSLINIRKNNLTISDALDQILNQRYEYHQSGNFVIIRYAPNELVLMVKESSGNTDAYSITGQIVDKYSGVPIKNASVYERFLLQSQLSDENGYFSMRLKNITQPIALTVTKENYKVITNYFLAEVNINEDADDRTDSKATERFVDGDLFDVEQTALGRALITTKQRIQSVNIGGLISEAPIQLALVPGINSHGSLSGQVVNNFSFNAIGAYSAGVDGMEIGLVFNINKTDVRYFQFAGAFNLAGGNVQGVQIAGLFNAVLGNSNALQIGLGYNQIGKNMRGVQVAGFYNRVKADMDGMQVSVGLNAVGGNVNGVQVSTFNQIRRNKRGLQIGVFGNAVGGRSSGFQIAGVANYNKEVNGFSVASLTNITAKTASGMQIAAFNYAKTLKGLQVGLINFSGKNEGYSIGLVNVALNGYHKIGFNTNETTPVNFVYKGGSKHLYNMLMFGIENKSSSKLYTGGLGFGTELNVYKRFSINPEISAQYVYQGSWDHFNLLNKIELPLNIRLNKWLAVQGGPSLNVYYTKQSEKIGAYGLLQEKHKDFSFGNTNYTGWLGWSVGLLLL